MRKLKISKPSAERIDVTTEALYEFTEKSGVQALRRALAEKNALGGAATPLAERSLGGHGPFTVLQPTFGATIRPKASEESDATVENETM